MPRVKVSANAKKFIASKASAFLVVSLFRVSAAYATLLQIPEPSQVALAPPKDDLPANIQGTFHSAPVVVPRMDTFVGELVKQTHDDRTSLLWSMYPASVRGRVFGGNVAGGNPLSGSGGW